jgi:glycine/D-amino acid oxidase-like deaminating enzyme
MMRFEPSIYLDALVKDVQLYGARIVIRKFDTVRDLMSVSEPIVVNCTGLGAKELFDDDELVPLKGQLTSISPQLDVNYGTFGGVRVSTGVPNMGIHMMPRSDGLILGGTSERGEWSLDVNEEERRRIVDGHIELFDAMRAMASGRAT